METNRTKALWKAGAPQQTSEIPTKNDVLVVEQTQAKNALSTFGKRHVADKEVLVMKNREIAPFDHAVPCEGCGVCEGRKRSGVDDMKDEYKKWYESSGYKLMESMGDLVDVEKFGFDVWQEAPGRERKRIIAKAIKILTNLKKDPGYYCGNKCLEHIQKELK